MTRLVIFGWNQTLWNPETQQLFPGVIAVLEILSKKYSLALAELIEKRDISQSLEQVNLIGVEKYFDKVHFKSNNSDSMYLDMLTYFEVKPEEVVLVDSRESGGIQFGNEIGSRTIFLRQKKLKEEHPYEGEVKPTYIIDSPFDLLAIL